MLTSTSRSDDRRNVEICVNLARIKRLRFASYVCSRNIYSKTKAQLVTKCSSISPTVDKIYQEPLKAKRNIVSGYCSNRYIFKAQILQACNAKPKSHEEIFEANYELKELELRTQVISESLNELLLGIDIETSGRQRVKQKKTPIQLLRLMYLTLGYLVRIH
jgi:hypothetical protein